MESPHPSIPSITLRMVRQRRLLGYGIAADWLLWLAAVVLAWSLSILELSAQEIPLPPALQAEQQHQIELVRRITAPTVCVHSADGNGGGSGVLISSDGLALTNYHVVQPCGSYMQCTLNDGQCYDAVIVGIDPTGDVALIQLLGRQDFPVAEWGDSDVAQAGQTCYAVGNPFLLATNRQPTVTRGIISGTHRYQEPAGTLLEYTDCLQIDASVNPGNSGGPLFNQDGQLIGINGRCSFEKRGRINVGVAYAISINQIRKFVAALKGGHVVDHATLGASFRTNSTGQVVVDQILEDSDVADLGLTYGDQLLEFGGQPIATVNQFKNRLGIFPYRWYVPIKFRHEGRTIEARVRLMELHSPLELQQTALPFQPNRRQELPDLLSDTLSEKHPIPKEAAKRIEFRPGFVNFYYNQLEKEKLKQRWENQPAENKVPSEATWSLRGKDRDRGPLRLEISGERAGFLSSLETRIQDWPQATASEGPKADAAPEAEDRLSDRHLMLLGLMAWHRLKNEGLEAFPLSMYLGRYPTRINPQPQDLLLVAFDEVEVEFFLDDGGRINSLICTQTGQPGGCEIQLDQWEAVGDSAMLPRRFQAYYRGETFLQFEAEEIRLSQRGENE